MLSSWRFDGRLWSILSTAFSEEFMFVGDLALNALVSEFWAIKNKIFMDVILQLRTLPKYSLVIVLEEAYALTYFSCSTVSVNCETAS